MSVPEPLDESRRLEVLQALHLLDTGAEAELDRLTHIASAALQTPIALISLVDATRQWFKSRVGLDATETPRAHAFCAYNILDDSVMVVPDALLDPRFVHNPLVTGGPRIRFYAAVPLVIQEQRIGSFCVIDRKPRELSPAESSLLQELAASAVDRIEARQAIAELERCRRTDEEMRQELAAKRDAMERFAFHAAHDLQGPLRTISAFLALLQEDYATQLDPEGQHYLKFAVDGAARLRQLTTDLLQFAEVEHLGSASREVDLDALLERVEADLRVQIESVGATIRAEPLPPVKGAGAALYQVVLNLVHNAITYTRPGVPPEVHITSEVEGDLVKVRFTDNGRGVPPNQQERVFEPFTRLEKRTGAEGSGLGLTIARNVAVRHDGGLRFVPHDGPGACVELTLPGAVSRVDG